MDIKSLDKGRVGEAQVKDTGGVKRSHKSDKSSLIDELSSQRPTKSTEKVELSADTALFAEGVKDARNAPDVRADKVAQLRAAVREGSYKVDAKAVADRILKDNMEELGGAKSE